MSAQKTDRNREILLRYEWGWTQELIARYFKISRPRVARILKETAGGKPPPRLASRNRRIRELWMYGYSPKEIAKATGLGARRIREIVSQEV